MQAGAAVSAAVLCSQSSLCQDAIPSLLSQSRASRRGFSRGTLPSRSQPASAPRLCVPPAFLPVTLLCGSLRVCLPDHTGGSGTGLAHGHRRLLMGAFEGGEKAVPGGEHTGQPRPSALQSPAPWWSPISAGAVREPRRAALLRPGPASRPRDRDLWQPPHPLLEKVAFLGPPDSFVQPEAERLRAVGGLRTGPAPF